MNAKLRIKQRREERIRRLLNDATREIIQEREVNSRTDSHAWRKQPADPVADRQNGLFSVKSLGAEQERDPETLWKKENGYYGSDYPVRFNLVKSLARRIVISAVVFGAVWGLFQLNNAWSVSPKTVITDALHRDMDFASMAAWYNRNFGGPPSFLPVLGHTTDVVNGSGIRSLMAKPISGTIVQPFALSMKGVEIVPEAAGASLVQVASSDAGRVLQVLGDAESGITVVIQHTGNVTAIYGRLHESEVEVNDWVEVGSPVGSLKSSNDGQPATLYFAVKEGEQYIDPAEVVALD
ncbi:peptidoglycan DD-metalloendopeptidase family protein [Paenibacillus tundrae]